MRLTLLLPLFVMIQFVSALEKKGCNLVIPEEVQIREEPQPESGPLIVHASFDIERLGHVPHSGGSFGIDVMLV